MLTFAVVSVGLLFAESAQAQQRVGLLGRLRGRQQVDNVVVSQSVPASATTSQSQIPVPQSSSTTQTSGTVTVMQMQTVQRRGMLGRMRTTTEMVPVTVPASATAQSTSGIQQAGSLNPSTLAPSTVPMTTSNNMVMPVNEGRQGILSRLRTRMGR
jgi:hypothetical protein